MNISKEEREKDQKSLQWHSNELQSLIKRNDSLKEEIEQLKEKARNLLKHLPSYDTCRDDVKELRDLLNTPKPPKV